MKKTKKGRAVYIAILIEKSLNQNSHPLFLARMSNCFQKRIKKLKITIVALNIKYEQLEITIREKSQRIT